MQDPMIEEVQVEGLLFAVIVRHGFHKPGVHFVTPELDHGRGHVRILGAKQTPAHVEGTFNAPSG